LDKQPAKKMNKSANGKATPNESADMGAVARHVARVAAKLFAERGFESTSVREIVEAAGIAKPTLYYHFQSKEGLAAAIVAVPLSNLVAKLRQIVTTVEDPIACLEQVIEARYAVFRDDPDRGRFLYSLLFGPSVSDVASEVESYRDSLISWTESAVRRLAEADVVARDRIDSCCTACRGLIIVSTLDFIFRDRALGGDLARRQVHDLLGGFGKSGAATGTR
jgi:AcrR family transcriptional regulator